MAGAKRAALQFHSGGECNMTKCEMTEAILKAKKLKQTTWAQIAAAASLSEVYVTSACLGENALDRTAADKVCGVLGLDPVVGDALTEYPTKGEASPTVPKEPLQYRFQEIIYVYGRT